MCLTVSNVVSSRSLKLRKIKSTHDPQLLITFVVIEFWILTLNYLNFDLELHHNLFSKIKTLTLWPNSVRYKNFCLFWCFKLPRFLSRNYLLKNSKNVLGYKAYPWAAVGQINSCCFFFLNIFPLFLSTWNRRNVDVLIWRHSLGTNA